MLIVALALSALNAIMGSGRALYQMALDGEFPNWFAKHNEHGVPARAMAFNVVASLIVVLPAVRWRSTASPMSATRSPSFRC